MMKYLVGDKKYVVDDKALNRIIVVLVNVAVVMGILNWVF